MNKKSRKDHVRFAREGVRMSRFPGIDFRRTPTGRKPHVTGTGLSVWELLWIWDDHGKNLARVWRNYPHLTASHIHAAVAYGRTFGDEMPRPPSPPSFAQKVVVPI